MENNNQMSLCAIEFDCCQNKSQDYCYHCSKRFCLPHLVEHLRMIEKTRRKVWTLLINQLNDLSNQFQQLNISSNVLERPFVILERWRLTAHEKIDQIVEIKRQKLKDIIHGYKRIFFQTKQDQQKEIESYKNTIHCLIEQNDENIDDLNRKIEQLNISLNSLKQHQIHLLAPLPDFSISFHNDFNDFLNLIQDELREFDITYIRLNGNICFYKLLVDKDGTIKDLKNSFLVMYASFKELNTWSKSLKQNDDHEPKFDLILPVEVYNHRVHMQYEETHSLNVISDHDKIVFYEISHPFDENNSKEILIPCSFRNASNKQPFGLPIYLNISYKKCQIQNIRDTLHHSLILFFPMNFQSDQDLYKVNVVVFKGGSSKKFSLDDLLKNKHEWIKINSELIIDIQPQMIQMYQYTH